MSAFDELGEFMVAYEASATITFDIHSSEWTVLFTGVGRTAYGRAPALSVAISGALDELYAQEEAGRPEAERS